MLHNIFVDAVIKTGSDEKKVQKNSIYLTFLNSFWIPCRIKVYISWQKKKIRREFLNAEVCILLKKKSWIII